MTNFKIYILLILTIGIYSCKSNSDEKNKVKENQVSSDYSKIESEKEVKCMDTIAIDYLKNKRLLNILKLLPETTMSRWVWSKKDRIKAVEFIETNNYLIDSTKMYNNIKYIKPNTIGIQVVDGFWTLSIYEFNENHSFIVTNDIVGDRNDIQTFNFINNKLTPLKMMNWFGKFHTELLITNTTKCIELIEDNKLSFDYDFSDKSIVEISSWLLTENEFKNCLKGNSIRCKVNKKNRTFDVIDVYWKGNKNSSFDKILKELRVKTVPLIEATNFDTFIEERKIYNKEEVSILQLDKIYPNYYKEGYNYRATPNYKMDLSKGFHSIVISIYKGDNEMESILINYDLNGEVIDSKVISYDEIAEGQSRIESEITHNKLTINHIFLVDKKQVTTEIFEIDTNGKIKPVVNLVN